MTAPLPGWRQTATGMRPLVRKSRTAGSIKSEKPCRTITNTFDR
jgi:hypothetical protein